MSRGTKERSPGGHRPLAWIGVLVLLSACADSSEGPGNVEGRPATRALISEPTAAPVAGAAAALELSRTFVSMAPGTEPGGDSITIVRLGGASRVGSRMTDGGFDPIALEADAGDTLAISVHHQSGNTSTTYGVVPVKGRPVIVRTSPTEGRTDVPLNCIIQVVFSEPMDSLSLVDALHLLQGGTEVPGTVGWTSANGDVLVGEFVPASPLEAGTSYQISVSTVARDVGGIALGAPLQVSFFTGTDTGGAGSLGSGPPQDAARLLALFPTGAPAGSPDVSLSIIGYFLADKQSYALWYAKGDAMVSATFSGGGAAVRAVIPAPLLSTPGRIQVFVYTGNPLDSLPDYRSNILSFDVTDPLPPPGTATIIVQAQASTPSPGPIHGYREVSLDGSEPRTLFEGGSLTYSGLAAAGHRLDLSNPCTSTHQPTTMNVLAVAASTVTVTVPVPPSCD